MISAFCPAHITCFFRPSLEGSILEKGSRGAGIRLKAGTTVHIEETEGATKVTVNGKDDDAKITKHVLGHMAPGRSFDVIAESFLPQGQGFGMSASGAVAASLCVAEMTGKSRKEAFEAAHTAEVVCGGGLGDVAGLMRESHVPIRLKAGMPPFGSTTDGGFAFEELTVIVLGKKLNTADVISDKVRLERICAAGDTAMDRFSEDRTKRSLFEISNKFSAEAGVAGQEVSDAIHALEKNGIRAAMCMLGNSIFTDACEEEVRRILGNAGEFYVTSSTSGSARIIRRA